MRACQELIPITTNFTEHGKTPNKHHGSGVCKDIHLQSKGRYQREMKKELLGGFNSFLSYLML